MFHEKIDPRGAILLPTSSVEPLPIAPASSGWDRAMAVLIVGALPFYLLWLLTRLIWDDAKAVASGLVFFLRALAEELAQQR